MFAKILIANRGEIACRIARSARRLGVATVAVFSDADAGARHVAACDEAHRLGPPPARESYLRGDLIIAIAQRSGAQAIHPGYGFLSENEDFAEACRRSGLVFIGPPPSAIRAMGLKAESKRLMAKAGVPLTPGYHGADQDPALLADEAGKIGYPVLIKASAGGGGKGMRIVEKPADFAAALASCQREARASFGDDAVLIEKYLTRPRHIEIQVFADTHGNCVHLFERDCSVQRRHQKVLEEAPAPGMIAERRAAMGRAAVDAAAAVGYVGAGTVEFIANQDGTFYFMEMNTRLQVEHPVTEAVTGVDLVEWQLRVAAGEPLPLAQDQLAIRGHALEARIYAENPAKNFLPSIGTITHLRTPPEGAGVRIDSGVGQGDAISPYYDPMIAKLICHGASRDEALALMAAALRRYEVAGLATNVEFLGRVVTSRAFAGGELDTGLIERHRAELLPALATPLEAVAAAVLADLAAEASVSDSDPWAARDGWRLSLTAQRTLTYRCGEETFAAVLEYGRAGMRLGIGERSGPLSGKCIDARAAFAWGDTQVSAGVARDGMRHTVFFAGRRLDLERFDPMLAGDDDDDAGDASFAAPMSGKVLSLIAAPGTPVDKGAALLVMEAMKMEHTLTAPRAGRVREYRCAAGDQVEEGALLIVFDAE
ncbi:MAG: acetyl/propionyl/methylcrotonyl-CoA carboxylase subunit alpha [Burkholderiales bacterium]|nr:acetyl/propionyl/methylcrotonyl-CoA carboxylase subunit alpha [Burkholderiales bacterium]